MYKYLIAGINWCAVMMLWGSAASVYINPNSFRLASVVGMAFPVFAGIVIALFFGTLLLSKRHAWIPVLGLVGCFFPLRNYYPINLSHPLPDETIKVISYNTAGYGGKEKDEFGRNAIAAYLAKSNADIICIQEANTSPTNLDTAILSLLRPDLPYMDTVMVNTNVLACYSRYPIVAKELISKREYNGSGVFKILPDNGDTIHVINCHLESMHLSSDDREQYKSLVKNPEESDVKASSRHLASKISTAAQDRALQADKTAEYIEKHRDKSLILCGDFNDTPISYTYNRIVSAGLTDAFVATGKGFGRSFNRDAIFVRIDYVMCSDYWKPCACYIDKTIKASDHYPVTAFFERR